MLALFPSCFAFFIIGHGSFLFAWISGGNCSAIPTSVPANLNVFFLTFCSSWTRRTWPRWALFFSVHFLKICCPCDAHVGIWHPLQCLIYSNYIKNRSFWSNFLSNWLRFLDAVKHEIISHGASLYVSNAFFQLINLVIFVSFYLYYFSFQIGNLYYQIVVLSSNYVYFLFCCSNSIRNVL